MRSSTKVVSGFVLAVSALATMPAFAATIPDGTVSIAFLYSPVVNLSTTPATASSINGTTFEVTGTGGFAGAASQTGVMNGTISFSTIVGTTLSQALPNLLTFSDGSSGLFAFSATNVTTRTFIDTAGSTSFSLYLLGNTSDANLGYSDTLTSLTISFNQTGSSAYSAAASLSVPPQSAVPEPASWAMMLGGFGLLGGSLRATRRKANVTFA